MQRLPDSAVLEGLDRSLVRALQVHPRASYAQLGEVLGISEQTAARRYGRLRREGLVRVVGAVNPRALGQTGWMVRLRCRPDGTAKVAEALAQREDVSWVTINSGGAEVQFSLRSRSQEESEDLLVRRLPKTAPVIDVAASALMRVYPAGDWTGVREALSDEQVRLLACAAPPSAGGLLAAVQPASAQAAALEPGDHTLLDLLAHDGRASYATLARASGLTVGRVMRRLDALQSGGVLYYDVDIAIAAIGPVVSASLWLQVPPDRLEPVGLALAQHDAVMFAAAISGDDNLVAVVMTDSLDALHGYLTSRLAGVEGISRYKLSPVMRRVKQAGAVTVGDRLSEPSSRRARQARPAAPAATSPAGGPDQRLSPSSA
jgi:DNA-binding Lrp family transcriptional regulator